MVWVAGALIAIAVLYVWANVTQRHRPLKADFTRPQNSEVQKPMNENYDLRSDFNTAGVFWKPSTPDQKFSAQLRTTSRHLDLTVEATLSKLTPETFVGAANVYSEAELEILNGFTGLGRCSILHLHSTGDSGLQHLPEGWAISAPSYRVSACIAGLHIDRADATVFKEAQFQFRGLEGWFRAAGELSFTDDGVSIFYPKKIPPVIDCKVEGLASRLLIRVSPGAKLSSGGFHSASPKAYIGLQSDEAHDLDWFVSTGVRLEHYFSLCLGTSVALKSVHLKTNKEGESGSLIFRRHSKHQRPDVRFWVQCDTQELQRTLSAWLRLREELQPVETLMYETIRQSDLFVETEFLALAQALESFHRLTDDSSLVDSASFAKILSELKGYIPQLSKDERLTERLVSSLQHANEPNFRDRILSLFGRLSPKSLEKLLREDPERFERALRQTRNYFTHAGTEKRGSVLDSGEHIFLFNQKLHALIRTLLLLYIGFSEEKVLGAVEQQVLRWN